MTDRELVGVILSSGCPATLRAPSNDFSRWAALLITRQGVSAARQSGKLQALSHKTASASSDGCAGRSSCTWLMFAERKEPRQPPRVLSSKICRRKNA